MGFGKLDGEIRGNLAELKAELKRNFREQKWGEFGIKMVLDGRFCCLKNAFKPVWSKLQTIGKLARRVFKLAHNADVRLN